jgi:predicted aldo/keto reductase-like oxidoreductase
MSKESAEDDIQTSGDDNYDPKLKDLKLSTVEKFFVAAGTFIVVLVMVLIHHPELYTTQAVSDKVLLSRSELLLGWAQVDETKSFSTHFTEASVGSYNLDLNGLTLSSIGVGTYLGADTDDEDKDVIAAIYDGIMKGVNVIDTAINYRGMKSEICIGKALKILMASGTANKKFAASRKALFICTKAGFIPVDAINKIDVEGVISGWSSANLSSDNVTSDKFPIGEVVDGKHCIAPACLNSSLSISRNNLGIDTIDLFYIHNAAEKQLGTVDRPTFMRRLEESFAFLEQARAENKIRYYGMATWSCFTSDPDSPTHLSLYDVVALAESVGGKNHGFRYIQVPVTATIPSAFSKRTQNGTTLLAAASSLNVNVVGSRSIGGGEDDNFARAENSFKKCVTSTDFSFLSPAAKSLLISRSVPDVLTSLVGMKSVVHVHENLGVWRLPKIERDVMTNCMFGALAESEIPRTDKLVLRHARTRGPKGRHRQTAGDKLHVVQPVKMHQKRHGNVRKRGGVDRGAS